jgi:hypothetical protein
MAENVRLFDEAIKQAEAKTVLYLTWARQHAPETQQAIADAYNSIGKELGAIVVPVGLAWQDFLAKHQTPLLYDRDQSHPTPAGTYLAACVFLTVLLKTSPIGIETMRNRRISKAIVSTLALAGGADCGLQPGERVAPLSADQRQTDAARFHHRGDEIHGTVRGRPAGFGRFRRKR